MKILLVEDDPVFAEQLSTDLTRQNYMVEAVSAAELGWEYAQSTNYDLIVLDIHLPDSDGISLCQKLRQANYEGAILLLTANSESVYKVRGLDAGADDYVVKPCTSEELCARIRALLRRPRGITATVLQWGALRLDPSTCQVFHADKEISLSPKEFSLLELFLRHPQRVFSSSILLERLWSFDETPGEETVRTHIKRLRRKLKKAGADQVIENIYGMGYRLMAPPTSACENSFGAAALSIEQLGESAPTAQSSAIALQAEARKATLAALSRFRPQFIERLTALDQFLEALSRGDCAVAPREQACQAAHKMVGSLGMFGLTEGSQLCQTLEAMLQPQAETFDLERLQPLVAKLHELLAPVLATPTSATEAVSPTTRPSTTVKKAAGLDVIIIADNASPLAEELAIVPLPVREQSTLAPAAAHRQLTSQLPDLILLDLAAFTKRTQGLTFLTELVTHFPALPIAVLSETDNFQVRLEVTRCGGVCTCLSRNLAAPQIWDSAIAWYHTCTVPQLHILAVDDDPVILKTLEKQLTADGIKVTALENPLKLWDSLAQTHPDLLLLDFEMPNVNGLELCRIIRTDAAWQHLPILFLSGQRDPELIQKIYQAGADDYIAKPVTAEVLLTRIINRVNRNRQLCVKS